MYSYASIIEAPNEQGWELDDVNEESNEDLAKIFREPKKDTSKKKAAKKAPAKKKTAAKKKTGQDGVNLLAILIGNTIIAKFGGKWVQAKVPLTHLNYHETGYDLSAAFRMLELLHEKEKVGKKVMQLTGDTWPYMWEGWREYVQVHGVPVYHDDPDWWGTLEEEIRSFTCYRGYEPEEEWYETDPWDDHGKPRPEGYEDCPYTDDDIPF